MTLLELDQTAKKAYYNMDLPTALRCYAEAFIQYPKLALAYNNYGNILREMGFPKEAYGFLETAINLNPNDVNAHFNYAVAHLAAGDLEKGWELFEARWKFKSHEHTLEGWSKPRWNGEDIAGKRLLITCEEGDGDNIQFIRFVNQLVEKNIIPVIQTEPQLKELFSNSFRKIKIIDNTESIKEFDFWTPILSLPKCLNITYGNFPKTETYLRATVNRVRFFKSLLEEVSKPKIGFCWRGRSKVYPFEEIINLIRHNNQYQWINLQVAYSEEEKRILDNLGVKSYTSYIKNWNDTAALIQNLDMVVSIDTGLIHLTGALKKEGVLLLDKYKTCWRWMYERSDSPWYPTLELVRQQEQNEFDKHLDNVNKAIAKKIDPGGSI